MTKRGLLDEKGLTLVEVLIASVITLILFLALMQTALLSIDMNTENLLRDEAVRIAEQKMSELRNEEFDSLATGVPEVITRNFRNFDRAFSVTWTITEPNPEIKQINIDVTWEWKERTVANENPYTHTISTILRNP